VTGGDDEFDDFLARRRKLFRRPEEDVLEPPHEVDRIVLRQAREAIESRNDQREIRGMAWGAPLALAASLLVAFTIILNVGMTKKEPVAEVTVEQVAQRRDYPPAADLSVPMAGNPAAQARPETPAAAPATVVVASPVPAEADRAVARTSGTPAWRHDGAAWLAEIQRLRAEGKTAQADAEMAEYKRQHKAYAGSPDR